LRGTCVPTILVLTIALFPATFEDEAFPMIEKKNGLINKLKDNELITIVVITGIANMAMAMLQPVMPLYLTSIEVTPSLIGLMLAAGMVGMVFGESGGGWLADKVGLKIPLMVGTFLSAPLVLCFVFTRNIPGIFLIFFFWGIFRAAIFGPGRGYISNAATLANKATLIAIYMTTQSIARSLGSLASGYIADNWGYDWNFYTSVGLSILAGITVIYGLRKIPLFKYKAGPALAAPAGHSDSGKPKVSYRLFIIQCVIVALFLLGAGVNSFLPLVATEVVGVTATEVGILYTITGVVNTVLLIPLGRLADRKDKKLLMVAGIMLSVIALVGIGYAKSYPLLIMFSIISSVSFATYTPAAVAMLSNTVPSYWQSTAMGVYGAAEDIGIILGSGAGGFVWNTGGPTAVYLMGAAAALAGAIICLGFIRRKSIGKA
jgi:predicted MFS family arabinose efflux permease